MYDKKLYNHNVLLVLCTTNKVTLKNNMDIIYCPANKNINCCYDSVDKIMGFQSRGPQFESTGSSSSALGQGTLSSLPSHSERT